MAWTGEGRDTIIWNDTLKATKLLSAPELNGNLNSSNISWTSDVDLGSNDLTTTGDIQSTTANLAGLDISNDDTKTTLLGTAGDYNRIGDAGVTSHGLASEDDLLITGKFEVNGPSYYDNEADYNGVLVIMDEGNQQSYIRAITDDGLHICPKPDEGRANNNVIITNSEHYLKNHGHNIASTNPTLFIHSDTSPYTNNTQWLSLAHDQTDGVISTGTGALNLAPASGLKINGTAGFTGTGAYTNFTIVNGIITNAS